MAEPSSSKSLARVPPPKPRDSSKQPGPGFPTENGDAYVQTYASVLLGAEAAQFLQDPTKFQETMFRTMKNAWQDANRDAADLNGGPETQRRLVEDMSRLNMVDLNVRIDVLQRFTKAMKEAKGLKLGKKASGPQLTGPKPKPQGHTNGDSAKAKRRQRKKTYQLPKYVFELPHKSSHWTSDALHVLSQLKESDRRFNALLRSFDKRLQAARPDGCTALFQLPAHEVPASPFMRDVAAFEYIHARSLAELAWNLCLVEYVDTRRRIFNTGAERNDVWVKGKFLTQRFI
jgi:hypothetical protein